MKQQRLAHTCSTPISLLCNPNFGGEDCTIKWNDGTVWNDVPCDYTYPCYCQAVKGGGTR